MCTSTQCGVAAHAKPASKATSLFEGVGSEEPLAFICFKADGSSVYTSPVRKVSEFGTSMDRYLKDQRTVTSWVSLFAVPTDAQPKTEEDFSDVTQRADMVLPPEAFTPRRKKIRFTMDSPEIKGEMTFATLPDSLGTQPTEVATTLRSVWPSLVANQAQMEVLLRRIKENTSKLASELSGDWDASSVRFERLDRKLGSWPAEFATSNLCTLATDLSNDLGQLSSRVGSLEDKGSIDVSQIEKDTAKKISDWLLGEFAPLFALFGSLSSEVKRPGDKFEALLARVTHLESRAGRGGQAAASFVPGGLASVFGSVSSPEPVQMQMDTDEVDVRSEIAELKDQIQALRDELMDDRVEISTVAFVSAPQCRTWMFASCVPSRTFFMFYDAMSLLTIITRSAVSIDGEMAQDKNAKSGSFASKEAAFYAASFALELPEIFGRETTSNQHRDDRELPALPSHKEWDSGSGHSGAKNSITKAVLKNVTSLRMSLGRYFQGEAKVVAEAMLTDSANFITELCNWISSHYLGLLTRTEAPPAIVWKLVAHDVREIFQLLYEARGPGRSTLDPEHFLWGTLRAHKVMQELRDFHFSAHPKLGHALNLHLQDNAVMKGSFKALSETVEALKKDCAEAKTTAHKALAKK
jgi:hypothetical protein